jgi:hypothetical protein
MKIKVTEIGFEWDEGMYGTGLDYGCLGLPEEDIEIEIPDDEYDEDDLNGSVQTYLENTYCLRDLDVIGEVYVTITDFDFEILD